MSEQFQRTAMLIGDANTKKLGTARVAVFGIGGVGGYCAESLARAGIEKIDLFDHDRIDITNINRQIIALHSTIGQYKSDSMRARLLDINPNADISANVMFYSTDTAHSVDLSRYDYIADCVDTVTAKLELITRAKALGVNIISSMGAGNKLNPGLFELADIYETSVCPLARVMRRELRKRGIDDLKVVYSKEEPIIRQEQAMPLDTEAGRSAKGAEDAENEKRRIAGGRIPASCAFPPASAGLMLAWAIVTDIINL